MRDMDMLQKLMEKKGKDSLDPEYKNAKMDVLKALHSEMGNLMGEDVKGFKKVTVAAPDKEGLSEGLEKAKEMVGDGEVCSECGEVHEGEHAMEEEMSPEALDAKIEELLKLKEKMAGKI